jgi:prepilin peptidase CpaA
MVNVAILLLLPAAVAFAAAMDLFTMTIPNRISVIMVLAFFPLAPLAGLGLYEMADHIGAGLLVLVIGVALFAGGWFGGGDAKLLAAIALWVGFDNLILYVFYVAMAGGMMALLFLTLRTMPLPKLLLGQPWAHRLHHRDGGIPYGIALAAGALMVYPQTVWFESLLR